MNYFDTLNKRINETGTYLCVGLDPDRNKLFRLDVTDPSSLLLYMKRFIAATSPYAAAYKLNMAFFEGWGPGGCEVIKEISALIPSSIPVIGDAKRGDIGNSARWYATSLFDFYRMDAVTVNPYLGSDSMKPFIEYKDKGVYVLCLTSNPGAEDFQLPSLYREIVKWCENNNLYNNIGLVVGATRKEFKEIAEQTPCSLLIPGIGKQGGDGETVSQVLASRKKADLVNVSRGIMFPSVGPEGYWTSVEEAASRYHSLLSVNNA